MAWPPLPGLKGLGRVLRPKSKSTSIIGLVLKPWLQINETSLKLQQLPLCLMDAGEGYAALNKRL